MSFNSTLPDGLLPETDVEGMKQFLSSLVTPKVHRSMFIQMSIESTEHRLARLTDAQRRRCTLQLASFRSWHFS